MSQEKVCHDAGRLCNVKNIYTAPLSPMQDTEALALWSSGYKIIKGLKQECSSCDLKQAIMLEC